MQGLSDKLYTLREEHHELRNKSHKLETMNKHLRVEVDRAHKQISTAMKKVPLRIYSVLPPPPSTTPTSVLGPPLQSLCYIARYYEKNSTCAWGGRKSPLSWGGGSKQNRSQTPMNLRIFYFSQPNNRFWVA